MGSARYIRGFESLDDKDPITDNPFFDQTIATGTFSFFRGSVGLTFRWYGGPQGWLAPMPGDIVKVCPLLIY
jgi:hypothetical protein